MQIALSGTELDTSDSITRLITAARTNGVHFIELWYPKNTEIEGIERTLSLLSEASISVACVATGSELYRSGGSSDDQALLTRAIELAHQLGAPFANTYFGYHSIQDDAAAIDAYQNRLHPCLALAEELGVTIVLENEFNAFGVDMAQSDITRRPLSLLQLMEQVASPNFRLTFDPCNYYFAGVEPFPYAYEVLSPYIAYIHVKDGRFYGSGMHLAARSWRRYRDFDREYIMQPLGQGAINWYGLLLRLVADSHAGILTLEPHADRSILDEAWTQGVSYLKSVLNCS
jgi:sugar phosphate isomerase/epimerase